MRSIDGHAAPDSPENRNAAARLCVQMGGGLAALGLLMLLGLEVTDTLPDTMHQRWTTVLITSMVLVWVPIVWVGIRALPNEGVQLLAGGTTVLTTALAFAMGGELSIMAGFAYVVIGTAAFTILETSAAIAQVVLIGVGYGLVVVVQDDNTAPAGRWLAVVGAVVIVGATMAQVVERVRRLADDARRATAEAEAAEAAQFALNRTLEERVTAQVDELARLGRLRRFLSTPVADAVLNAGEEDLLEPHRKEIAVIFCDLRGFTAFATTAQPEEVHAVLTQYFDLLGKAVGRHDATVGGFTGDGLMAFFNDPLPCRDPAGDAIAMALDLQAAMATCCDDWLDGGYALGFGAGVAYGYANIGVIGFDGRRDYSALGPVVNLASRLCAEASPGEVLVDQRALSASCHRDFDVLGPRTLRLKGFHHDVVAHALSASRGAAPSC